MLARAAKLDGRAEPTRRGGMRDLLIPDSPETPRVEMINHRGANSAPVEKEVWGGLQLNDAQPAAPRGVVAQSPSRGRGAKEKLPSG